MNGSIAKASTLVDDVFDLARGKLGGRLVVQRDSDAPLTPVLPALAASS
jgi:hypothetical protein